MRKPKSIILKTNEYHSSEICIGSNWINHPECLGDLSSYDAILFCVDGAVVHTAFNKLAQSLSQPLSDNTSNPSVTNNEKSVHNCLNSQRGAQILNANSHEHHNSCTSTPECSVIEDKYLKLPRIHTLIFTNVGMNYYSLEEITNWRKTFPLIQNTALPKTSVVSPIDAEAYKTPEKLFDLLDLMHNMHLTRKSLVVAQGGGAICDMVHLAASLYQRGTSCTLLPTTLLAMVDASVGGKCAINAPYAKNAWGIIDQPQRVLIDTQALTTLDKLQFASGSAEVIKQAALGIPNLWKALQTTTLFEMNPQELADVIYKNVQFKQSIVELDAQDTGLRHQLNFGHTFGHAFEHISDYKMTHGQAVALGMIAATQIGIDLGLSSYTFLEELINCLRAHRLLEHDAFAYIQDASWDDLVSILVQDKKRSGTHLAMIFVASTGQPCIKTVEITQLSEIVGSSWFSHLFGSLY